MPFALKEVKPCIAINHRSAGAKDRLGTDSTDSWLTDGQHSKKVVSPVFGHHMKSILAMFKISGALPIYLVDNDRKWHCKWLSFSSLYSLCIYTIVVSLLALIIRDVSIQFEQLDNFDDEMLLRFVILIVIPYGLTPLTSWRDAKSISQYLNEWTEFQKQYLEVTRANIIYTRRLFNAIYCAFTIFAAGSSVFAGVFLPPYLKIWQTTAMPFVVLSGLSIFGYYISFFNTLSYTGRKFAQSFQIDMGRVSIRSPRQLIRNYERLWLSLSKLANQLGRSSFRTLALVMCFSILLNTLCFYQFLSSLTSEDTQYIMTAFYALNTCGNAIPAYTVCNMSYLTSRQIERELKKHLWEMILSDEHANCTEEISSFLRTIHDNPPTISVGGFVTLNRYLIPVTAATIIAYLTYVIQIRLSSTDVAF